MPTNYNGYTVPAPTDIADAPAAFEEFSDSIPFSEYVAVESLSADTTVVDSYNGKMIFATADITLTFGTLTDGFSVAVTADTGVTVDYLGVDKASQQTTAYQIASVVAVNGTNIISIAVASTPAPAVVPQGEILQVVSATSGEATTTSTTFSDTGLTATITPTSATSTILVMVLHPGIGKIGGDTTVWLQLLRGATVLSVFEMSAAINNSTQYNGVGASGINYVDSPATTSAVVYKTQYKSQVPLTGTEVVYVGQSGGVGSIVLMEVAA